MKKKNRCADEFPSSSIRKYIGYPDSAYIHFDEVGAVLFIFRANPSLKELDGFEKKFEIRITEFSKIMFISFRFGSSDWCSISYSPYLDTWQSKQFIFPNCKYGINLFIALFDTSTGKILRPGCSIFRASFQKKYALPLYCRHCSHSIKRNILKLLSSLLFSFARRNCSAKQIIITLHSPLSCITDCPYTKIMNYFHTTHFKIIRKMQNHYSVFHKKLKVR